MADGIDFKIEGLEAVAEKLKAVAIDVRFKGGRYALRKSANVVRDQAVQNASRVDRSQTKNSIAKNVAVRFSTKLFKRTGDLGFRIGMLGGARAPLEDFGEVKGKGKDNPGGDTFYWRFVEFGTSKAGAKPFFTDSLKQSESKAIKEFVTEYGKALDRAIKKASKGKK